jgi:hypothetical protein
MRASPDEVAGIKIMGIRFYCPNGHKLNVKDFQAGQKGVCPVCDAVMQIPMKSTRPSSRKKHVPQEMLPKGGGDKTDTVSRIAQTTFADLPTLPLDALDKAADSLAEVGSIEENAEGNRVWYVRPTAGGQYGPATAPIIRTWLVEGRVGRDTLVWCEGWPKWRRADHVFSQWAAEMEVLKPEIPPIVEPMAILAPNLANKRRAQAKNILSTVITILILIALILSLILAVVWLKR